VDMRGMWNLFRSLREMRQREHWTRPELQAYQASALGRLRAHAYAHYPFYQRFHQGLTDRPLAELPVLSKATLMAHRCLGVSSPQS
jgi:phenylacetate-coenzyme A ligase PaaK-like adenylate-forming protein